MRRLACLLFVSLALLVLLVPSSSAFSEYEYEEAELTDSELSDFDTEFLELESLADNSTSSSQGPWIGQNTTVVPAKPAPLKPEPAQQTVNPAPADTIATSNNNVTSSSSSSSSTSAPSSKPLEVKNPGFIKELRFDPASRERRTQARRVVSPTPGSNEVSVANYTAIFSFVQAQTSEGYTIDTFTSKNIEELAEACSKDVRCTGFTSTGELKSFIRPASKWVALDTAASTSINTDLAASGIYYLPQWYRFQPVPCPCGADVALNFICSDPNSGDQYLGDPLTDSSCYRAKPLPLTHTCSTKTCVKLGWVTKPFPKCATCGLNVTVNRPVSCQSAAGTVYPNKFCKLVEPQPDSVKICAADVECSWSKVEGECQAPCGRGYKNINVTCTSPVDSSVVPDSFCTSVKPKTVRKCRVKDCVWNTVPDGKCSFSCGAGHRQLKATCIEASKPDVVLADKQCAGVKRPAVLIKCNNRPCNWETKATSPCSQPCGKGQQAVANTCKDPLSGDVMPAKQCGEDPPPSFQYCSLKQCAWETKPFGLCSTTCGSGTQYFNVTCRDPSTGHRVDDAQCKTLPPPAPEAPCENNACGWRTRPIGECSSPCGEGIQKFNVTCEDPITGKLIDESLCGANKPNATQSCHVRECHWHRASKGKCSSPCGPGIQAYSLTCQNPDDGSKQKKKQCKNIPVPALSEPCFLHSCEWHAQNDGACDQICGPGRQQRTISCHDPVSGTRVPKEHCTGKAPSTNTKCYAQACVWSTTPTTQCSNTCGLGSQQVNVTCTDPKRRFVLPDTQCFDASRPNTTQSCNLQACRWKATPASACSTTCGKGVQKLNVACRDPITGKEQQDGLCDDETKPADAQTCFIKPCTWVSDTPVAKCSQPCGPGHVSVNVTCQDAQVGLIVNDTLCSPDPKPDGLQPCQLTECVWAANWTDCKRTCGGDFQYSTIACQTEDGQSVSNTQCKAAPATWRQCNTAACLDIKESFLFYNFDDEVTGAGSKVFNKVTRRARYGLDGIVQGTGAKNVVGRGARGKAISLPAAGDHNSGPSVVIPAGKKLTSPSFSLSFWMQLLAAPTQGRFYIIVDNRGTNGGGEGFVIYLDPRDGLLYLNDAYSAQLGKSHFADSGIQFPNDGQYHHVTVTYNQKLVKFFIDGKQTSVVDPSHAFKFTVDISQHSVHLRGSPDKYWRYLPMNLDEFAYFSYPLKADQVAVLADFEAKNVCEAGKRLTGGGCSLYKNVGDALNSKCAGGSPYSLAECLQPLWGLNQCSTLGSTYPAAFDQAAWNEKKWKDIKKAVTEIAKRDVEPELAAKASWGQCKNRAPSGLDRLCDHPPPFHTNVCLQGLFLEMGCSRKASGFPASASHPLTVQLNELSWRDVKAKIRNLIDTDVKGGLSEGMCHGEPDEVDTQ